MGTVTISLPDPMVDWVEGQIRDGVYPSLNDYFRTLVIRDKAETQTTEGTDDGSPPPEERPYTIEEVRQIVRDARASGVGSKTVKDIAEEAKAVVRERGRLRG